VFFGFTDHAAYFFTAAQGGFLGFDYAGGGVIGGF